MEIVVASEVVDKIVVLGGRNAAGALRDVVSYFPSRDAGGEDPWEGFVDLPEERYGFGVASVSGTIYAFGGSVSDEGSSSVNFISDGETWSEVDAFPLQQGQTPELVPLGSVLYVLHADVVTAYTGLWSYQAFYFEIFLPIIQ